MATTKSNLTTSYSDLGSGPRFLEVKNADVVRVHFAGSAPGDGTDAFHLLSGPEAVRGNRAATAASSSLTYSGSQNCYARSESGSADIYHTNS